MTARLHDNPPEEPKTLVKQASAIMTNQPSMRIVIIGGFGHAWQVLDEFQFDPRARIAGIAPAYPGESLDRFLAHPSLQEGVSLFADYRTMLGALRPDVAIVSTRLDRIPHVAAEAARAGCHLICEKPLALDLDTLAMLRRTVDQAAVRLLPMFTMRSLPVFRATREVVRAGTIGDVALVNVRKSYRWGERPAWFAAREFYGGTIGWAGVHAIDLLDFILGNPGEPLSAWARNVAHHEWGCCEDIAALTLRLPADKVATEALATVSIDLLRPDAAESHADDWIRIVGTRGILEASQRLGRVELLVGSQHEFVTPEAETAPIFSRFLESLHTGELPADLPSLDAAFAITSTTLRTQELAATAHPA